MSDHRPSKGQRRTTSGERRMAWSFAVGLWLVVVAMLLAACGGAEQRAEQPTAPTPPAATPAGPTAAPSPGPGMFANPVIDQDFPDPDTIKAGDAYYAYATNAGGSNIQMAQSADLVHWRILGDALPVLPSWAQSGFTWAPEVTTGAGGQGYVMYFVARDSASQKQCIGVAASATPEGPFSSTQDRPLICQLDLGGSIDPSSFTDAGARYVLWKNDGNCCGLDTWLFIQKVSDDGLQLAGAPTQLIHEDQTWEGNLVEAPTLWKHGSKYYLFYSANSYAGVDYAVGYAIADQVAGPYTKPNKRPLLATDLETGAALGPGGQDVVSDKDGETWMLYHSWDPTASYRRINIDKLIWQGDAPAVKAVKGPQPLP